MKFRGVKVKPKTIIASSPEELDRELSKFKEIYDLQFSTHYMDDGTEYYCALILIEVKSAN